MVTIIPGYLLEIWVTRTAGAAGPLVLECGGSVLCLFLLFCIFCLFCLFVFLVFRLTFVLLLLLLLLFLLLTTSNFLFLLGTEHAVGGGGGRGSFAVMLFFFFFFFLLFFLTFFLFFFVFFAFLSFSLFVARVHIYYHTNFCSNLTIFQFYHTFYHILPSKVHHHYQIIYFLILHTWLICVLVQKKQLLFSELFPKMIFCQSFYISK